MSLKHYVLLPLLFLSRLVLHSAQEPRQNPDCSCFKCASFGEVGFPFSNTNNPKCGFFVSNCTGTEPKVRFHEKGNWYHVDYINYYGQKIRIRDHKLKSHLESNNCASLNNFTEKIPSFLSINVTGTRPFFKCKRETYSIPESNFLGGFHNYTSCKDGHNLYFYGDPKKSLPFLPETMSKHCSLVLLPSSGLTNVSALVLPISNLTLLWYPNFFITWQVHRHCHLKGDQCCQNGTFECGELKKPEEGNKGVMKALIGTGIGIGFLITCIIFLLYQRRERNKLSSSSTLISRDISNDLSLKQDPEKGSIHFQCEIMISMLIFCWKRKHSSTNSTVLWKREKKAQRAMEIFLNDFGSLAPKRYDYSDIKQITSSFKAKIGEGGYGCVYKGKLRDGHLVAVKLLNKIKGDGEEFINEVASISRTSHVNVVNLLGFCFEGSKRALVYEYMVNGSLEKFIYGSNLLETQFQLGWETLYQIAIGTARGLEYLHRGCNTRIVHFDIKPHNILLDKDFTPKISDFGLAKLCPRKESIISMLGARGTVGYMAPEFFCRNFGGVSHKSDVYSYGMMVLEIVGKRKNIDVRVDHTSEIYFPHWIYKHLEQDMDLGLRGIMSPKEGDLTRNMILVALWCIQTNPMDRPAMSKVVEMLEGRSELLSIPPKPYLCSQRHSGFLNA